MAYGSFCTNGDGNFSGTFLTIPDLIEKSYIGSFSRPVPKFKATNATLTYCNPGDPSGDSRIIESSVAGASVLNLTLENNMSITGKLDEPLPEEYTVTGSGSWFSS
ncbi:hypothetical protein AX17_005406 [Amanita inopinata Kibby_2008]|nr:hypothetical protein AX17_005406 [Amanita inopinata Kibby_2008]